MRHLLLALALIPFPALAHKAPTGWAYDYTCCNTYDCRPVEPHSTGIRVEEVTEGWLVLRPNGTQVLVMRDDSRLKQSKDSHYHICTTSGSEDGYVLCLYVPFRGY